MASGNQMIEWRGGNDAVKVSPRDGGRVVSWLHHGQERVLPPSILEGGLFRVLFAEEQYPGSSYVVPHAVIEWSPRDDGFTLHMRHFWNASNAIMHAIGWPEKANELHIDGLLLDKVLSFDASRSSLTCEIAITNVTRETKHITPWVHNAMSDWSASHWMVVDGRREAYADTDIYWGSHLAQSASTMAMVHANADGKAFSVFQADPSALRGMAGYVPIPGEFHQSTCELRYAAVALEPGRRWRANSTLAMTDDWEGAAQQSSHLFARDDVVRAVEDYDAIRLLEHWMLPAERDRGWMVLSFLDKPPFSSSDRFDAAHCFAGFHAENGQAVASVAMFAAANTRPEVVLTGSDGWRLRTSDQVGRRVTAELGAGTHARIDLVGPLDFAGARGVAIEIVDGSGAGVRLMVDHACHVEPRYEYQVRQAPVYLRRRHAEQLGPPPNADAVEVGAWQERMRARLRLWLDYHRAGDCALEPRLVERQIGPTCIREKWLVQTEPGIWVPGYLVHPIGAEGPLPLLYQLHGSGPGKDGFAPDEQVSPVRMQLGHELEYMPYGLATAMPCRVFVPDGRGQGEMGETNPGIWPARINAMGISNTALRVWDQIRTLDWLVTRDDVDASRVGSQGCSGGGGMTYWFAAADERIAASIVSSTNALMPPPDLVPGYFDQMFADPATRVLQSAASPLSGPALGMLAAPRPMWVIDGMDDLLTPSPERAAWRAALQSGRDQVRDVYRRLGAEHCFADDWFEGGHCGGMTVDNVAAWFKRWFDGEAAASRTQ